MMINMFDTDNDGGINLTEFQSLWNVSRLRTDEYFSFISYYFSISMIGPTLSEASIGKKKEPFTFI
jgi:hypothetical protein